MSRAKLWKNKISKAGKFALTLAIISSWVFSGWPQVWQNPKFPPEIKKARAAFDNGYGFRRLIDITDAQVSSGPHTDFPMLVSTTLADLKTTGNGGDVTNANGYDIIFTSSDGTTVLNHEIEKYVATTGEIVMWVKVPSLAATSTIYMYYGNSSISTSQENITGTWNSNFKGVWHLDEGDSTAADFYKDSTSNANNGTLTDADGDSVVGTKIDGAFDFNGDADKINVGTGLDQNGEVTITVWINSDTVAAGIKRIVGNSNSGGSAVDYDLEINRTAARISLLRSSAAVTVTSNTNLSASTWYHVAGVLSGSTSSWTGTIYVNGSSHGSAADTNNPNGTNEVTSIAVLGADTTAGSFFDGDIDEVRVSSTALSAGWITTEYNNQNDPAGFYTFGSEEVFATFTQSAYRLFDNDNSVQVGSALAAQDTAATLGSTGAAFRLRMLIHVATAELAINGQNLKLQFAERSGTCDTSFSGETYADVTASTVIAYNDNSTPVDGNNLSPNGSDPTHGADLIVNQDYEELNNFTNSVTAIPSGQDGKWDFSLKDNSAPSSTSYCFRAVKSSGTVLDTYSVVPQITTSGSLTFSISDNGIGFGTLSSSASRWADGDATGEAAETVAHTLVAATNATSGYVMTVNGNTLTCSACGGATVSAIGPNATAHSAGTEQFGINLVHSGGSGTASAPYNDQTSPYTYAFDTGNFPDQIASSSGTSANTTYSVYYIGNITSTTKAGSYTATLTYVVTATF